MYLKRLHLKGFKSFADKTEILFKPGVNILVGPNGCGKSNVVDALRWVLGSSRAKELRAGRQEDVIFNGAEGIRPQNMARVEMVLDNTDGMLPLAYSEIGVSRKLFRTGETEFQINQAKVRLKDIGELFNDTGIGRQGYAVIGQGEVDAVVTGKPWDRRMMIEEAAGMIRYRQEREEILRRLTRSQNDGLRLTDLLTEIKSRLEVLAEKAEKARQYADCQKERLEKLEQVLTAEIAGRSRRVQERSAKKAELKARIDGWNAEIAAAQAEEAAARTEAAKAAETVEAAFAALEQLESGLREKKSAAGVLRERLKHVEQNAVQLGQEIEQNRQQIARITPDIAGLEADYDSRRREMEEETAAITTEETRYQEQNHRLEAEEAALSAQQRALVAETRLSEELAQAAGEAKTALLSLQEERKFQTLRLSEQRDAEQEEQRRLAYYTGQLQELKAGLEDCVLRHGAWEKALPENRRRYENSRQAMTENEQLANRLKSQIQVLDQMMENYALHSDSVRRFLLAVEHGDFKLPGLLGGVAELIETPPQLAVAVETALGGSLDNLVTRTAEDARSAIDYLKRTQGGRVTFLPLDNLRYQPLPEEARQRILQQRGVAGIASEVITYAAEAAPAVEYLLGRTVIVENMEVGLKVFRSVRQSLRVVSLDGDIVNPGGTMTGGSRAKNRSGVLERKARKKLLQQEWRQALKVWQDSMQAFTATEKNWQQFTREGELLRTERQSLTLKGQTLQESTEQQRTKQEAATAARMKTEEALSALQTALKEKEQALEAGEKEAAAQKEKLLRLQETSGTRQDAFQELQKDCELLRERIKGMREQLATKEQELVSRAEYLQQLEGFKASYTAAMEQSRMKLEEKRTEERTVREELRQLEAAITSGDAEIQAAAAALDGLQEAQERAGAKEAAIGEQLKPLREQLEKGISGLHDQELLSVRLETELSGWLERWMQEIGRPWTETDGETVARPGEVRESQARILELERQIQLLGEVDPGAVREYEETLARAAFMESQLDDLTQAHTKLVELLNETERHIERQFTAFYAALQQKFNETFQHVFAGGTAQLRMEEDPEGEKLDRGVEITVQLPGKRVQSLQLLSGGEKALTGIAFVFALISMKNAPFCVMDEVDAPLDEVNLGRFITFVGEMSQATQFIIISHRQATIASGEVIYGVTMARRGVSRVLSLDLEEAAKISGIDG